MQSAISLQDFQDAEPDFLVHSTSAIVERFSEKGIRCDVALKALCKKKGLHVEVTMILLFLVLYLTLTYLTILKFHNLYAANFFYRTHWCHKVLNSNLLTCTCQVL